MQPRRVDCYREEGVAELVDPGVRVEPDWGISALAGTSSATIWDASDAHTAHRQLLG